MAGDRTAPAGPACPSFGISGTNAHVVLEQAPATAADDAAPPGAEPCRPRRARAAARLPARPRRRCAARPRPAARIACPADGLADSAVLAGHRRAALAHRAVVLAADRAEARRRALRALAQRRVGAGLMRGTGARAAASPSCSPARAASAPAWAASCTRAFPVFAGRLRRRLRRRRPGTGRATSTGRCGTWSSPSRLGRCGAAGPDRVHPARAVRCRGGALPAVSSRGGCGPTCWSATPSASWPPRTSPACCRLRDACPSSRPAARLMQALPAGGAMVAVEATEDEVLRS